MMSPTARGGEWPIALPRSVPNTLRKNRNPYIRREPEVVDSVEFRPFREIQATHLNISMKLKVTGARMFGDYIPDGDGIKWVKPVYTGVATHTSDKSSSSSGSCYTPMRVN